MKLVGEVTFRRVVERYISYYNLDPTRVWRIENGYVTPSPEEQVAIAQALDVDQAEIWPSAGQADLTA